MPVATSAPPGDGRIRSTSFSCVSAISLASSTFCQSLASKHALLLAVGLRYRRLRSSMLRAIERGRPPAVDFLNGEIIERARRLEVPAPINEAIADRIGRVARGEAQPGHALVAELYRSTR